MPVQYDGFYEARRAREIASGGGGGNTNVLAEINVLQVAIDAAARSGHLSVQLSDTVMAPAGMGALITIDGETLTLKSRMGTGEFYVEAWRNSDNQGEVHRKARLEMDQVIGYFTRLGYSIRRLTAGGDNTLQGMPVSDDATAFRWVVQW